jgi:hypothetical protein
MTPSQQAKAEGLTGLSAVSKLTGVSLQTLHNWHKDKPELFRVVIAGCKAKLQENNMINTTSFIVAEYQGNVYSREVHYNDTTVYMDNQLGSFATQEEADDFINEVADEHGVLID